MSQIPFRFDHKPHYFRDNGWFKPKKDGSHIKRLLFIDWAFSRCWAIEREIFHDNKKIILKPYQFIFGRRVCSEETGLTEDEVRTQVFSMQKAGFLKNAPNKTPSRFTIYEWVEEAFSENNPQVNPQLTPKSPPSQPHNTDIHNSDKVVDVCDLFVRAHEENPKGEEMTIPLITARHKTHNAISIRKTSLIEELQGTTNAISLDEIEDAIIIFQESNPVVVSTIPKYILGIITKKRKELASELRRVNDRKSFSQQDLVSKSARSITEATVTIKGAKV